jgi:hypothetical protein
MWQSLFKQSDPKTLKELWEKAKSKAEAQNKQPQRVFVKLNGAVVQGLKHPLNANDLRLHIAG